jgi:hypothetical protein
MNREEYELFEHLPDGSLSWRGLVRGLRCAQIRVWQLADATGNACFAMDSTGTEIVLARTPLPGAKRIFQVAYSKVLALRGHLLRRDGYDVTSVSGNHVARFALHTRPVYDLFVIGHGASDSVRLEMVHWLRACYPNVTIVALNTLGHIIDGLRYNAPSEPVAAWLPMISAALHQNGCVGARGVVPGSGSSAAQ